MDLILILGFAAILVAILFPKELRSLIIFCIAAFFIYRIYTKYEQHFTWVNVVVGIVCTLVAIRFIDWCYGKLYPLPDNVLESTEDPITTETEKICPRCAESVKAAAKVCRFCGHEFTVE